MIYFYRVRGPYSTAIAKLIIDAGHQLVDLSNQLAQRFSLPPRREEIPHATIKSSNDDPNTIIIVGLSKAVEELFTILISNIPYTAREINKHGPYTTVVAQSKGYKDNQCLAEYKDTNLIVQNYKRCVEGEPMVVHIVKPAISSNKIAIAFPGVSILKDTIVLINDGMGKIFFSEHIRDQERRSTLLSLSNHVLRMGYSIRWRSSAKSAILEKIARDLEEALTQMRNLDIKKYKIGDVIAEGEAIAFIRLSRPSKEYLDRVRDKVISTALGHHTIRVCMGNGFVDVIDRMSRYLDLDKEVMYKAMKYALVDNVIGKTFKIIHRKMTGEKIEFNDFEVLNAIDTSLGRVILGRRIIKSSGIYDGLEIVKERGDIVITVIPIDEWFIIHRYIGSDGSEKGFYININTPPELCLDNKTIEYVDLYIDVVYRNDELRIIDREELESAVKLGLTGNDLIEKIENVLNYIKNNLNMIIHEVRKTF